MIKNSMNICSNCGEENPLYFLNCKNCHHYLRENVININLWETIFQLFDGPEKALKNIIFAVHKNYITFLIILLSLKFYLTSIIVQSALNFATKDSDFLLLNGITIIFIYAIIILIFAKIVAILLKSVGRVTRYKDTLSILTFSFIPIILASCILLPIEYGIFGKHWFVYNPSPFLIKSVPAYILISIEAIMLIWSISILIKGFYLQSDSKKISFLIALFFILTFFGAIVFIPYILF